MKIHQKSNRFYWLSASLVFLPAVFIIYYSLSYILEDEAREKLLEMEYHLKKRIELGKTDVAYLPGVRLKKAENQRNSTYFKNTQVYDPHEKEMESFLELHAVFKAKNQWYELEIRTSSAETEELSLMILLALLGIILLLLLTLFIINKQVSKRIWNPFLKNIGTIQQFKVFSNKPLKLEETDIDEFRQLNNSLSHFVNLAQQDFQILKQFSENASHELQTPLAIIQSKLEQLSQSLSLNEADHLLVNSMNNSLKRLNKLTADLLMLTKIDNKQFEEKQEVNLNEIIRHKLGDFSELLQAKQISSQYSCESESVLYANQYLLEVLFSNLINNAIQHNTTGGEIEIVLTEYFLKIRNTGEVHDLNQQTVFKRFTKSNSASNGLGLSIVYEIVQQNNWDITYDYQDKWHSFKIEFKTTDLL